LRGITVTRAQLELIGHLIDEALQDERTIERRWQHPKVAPFARDRAKAGHLLLVRDWTADIVLSRDGEMIVIDTEDGQPPRPATDSERRVTLFRSITRYPELLSLLPPRPSEAIDCPACSGTGVLTVRFVNPKLRDVVCRCGGGGWITAGEMQSE